MIESAIIGASLELVAELVEDELGWRPLVSHNFAAWRRDSSEIVSYVETPEDILCLNKDTTVYLAGNFRDNPFWPEMCQAMQSIEAVEFDL